MSLAETSHGLGPRRHDVLADPATEVLRERVRRRTRFLRWTLIGGATLAVLRAWRERAAALAGRRRRFEPVPPSPVDAASAAIARARTMTARPRPRSRAR